VLVCAAGKDNIRNPKSQRKFYVLFCAVQETAVAKAVAEAGEVPEDATAALLITGLKRPFTPNALAQVLAETGIVKGREGQRVLDGLVSCQSGYKDEGRDVD
jgi:hypothetical protein